MTTYIWNGSTGDWSTSGDWTPAGVPGAADSAVIAAAGSYALTIAAGETETVTGLTLDAAGATLAVDGSLAVSGVLALDAGTLDLAGVLSGATVDANGGTAVFSIGTLDGVTWQGALTIGDSGILTIENGLTLEGAGGVGAGTLNVEGVASELVVADSETLSNAVINVGNDTLPVFLNADATLTLAANVTLNAVGAQGFDLIGSGAIVNDGTINATVAGGLAAIDVGAFDNAGVLNVANGTTMEISSAPFTNTGSIFVGAGSELDLFTNPAATQASGGTVTVAGLLNGEGGTIDLGATGAFADTTLSGTLADATVASDGGAINFAIGTLDATTWQGTLTVGDSGIVSVENGLTVEGAGGTGVGTINVEGVASELVVVDAETLSNVVLNVGNDALPASLNVDTALTLAAGVTLNSVGAQGFDLIGGGTIVNDGIINATVAGGLAAIDVSEFDNAGVLTIANGTTAEISSAPFNNTGTVSVSAASLDVNGTVGGTGVFDLAAKGVLSFDAAVTGQTVAFTTAGGVLVLNDTAAESLTLAGFASGDRVDLTGFATLASKVAYASGVVTVTDGSAVAQLHVPTLPAGQAYGLVSDGNGGSFLVIGQTVTGPAKGNATISVGNGNAIITANGSGNIISAGNGDDVINAGKAPALVSFGNGNVVTTLSGAGNIVVGGNGSDIVTGSTGATLITLGNGNNQVNAGGLANLIALGSGNNTVNAGSGSDIVTLSGGTAALTFAGTGDYAFLGASNATVNDLASKLNVVLAQGAGTDVIENVAADPHIVVDLVGGVGGYASAQAAYAALQSDGHGGSLLALGTGSIDFAGVAPTGLSAANFHVIAHMS